MLGTPIHTPLNTFTKATVAFAFLLFLSPSIQPALINPNEVPWYTIPSFALITFAVYLITGISKNRFYLITVVPLALCVVPILFHAGETPIIRTLFYFSFIIALFGLWTIATNASSRTCRELFIVYLIAAFIWSLLAMIVWLGLTNGEMLHIKKWALTTIIQNKINGPFANGNVFGILIFSSWAITIWLWLKQTNKSAYFLFLLMTFFWSLGIASLSRGAWIAHSFVAIVVFIHLLLNNRRRLIPFIIALLIALPLGSTFNNAGEISQPIRPVQQFEVTHKEGFGARLLLWAASFEVWKTNPWLGTGYGGLGAHYLTGQYHAFEKYGFDLPGLNQTTYAHNAPLHLLAEGGIAGALLAIFISFFVMLTFILNWKRIHSVTWPATMIASMLWLQGLANISMTQPFPIMLFCLSLGIALRAILISKVKSYPIPKKHYFLPIIASLLILCSGAYTQTKAWSAYGEWIKIKNNDNGKKTLIHQLLLNESTMPYMVGDTVKDVILTPAKHHMAPQLIPFVSAALSKLETQLLYQGLFFTQALSGDMNNACTTGRFILMQNWKYDRNERYYRSACEGTLSKTLTIQK